MTTGIRPSIPVTGSAGARAPPPEYALRIPVLRKSSVGVAERVRHRALRLRQRHDVYVIGHQTVGKDAQAVRRRVLGQQFQVGATRRVRREDILPGVPTLRDVMWKARGDDSRFPRHISIVRIRRSRSQKSLGRSRPSPVSQMSENASTNRRSPPANIFNTTAYAWSISDSPSRT